MPIFRATFGWSKIDSEVYNQAIKDLKEHIKLLNTHLQGKDYLVGNHLTVADIIVGLSLVIAYQTVLDGGFRKAMPNTSNWVERVVRLPEVVARLGNVKFAAKTIKPVLEEKKKEEAAPKQVAAPKKAVDEDGEEVKPKDKDPRDEPSKLDLYSFKTFFVNHEDRRGAGMQFFFENYVKEDYCIYFVHYEKYEGEGTVLYQTANMLNGFLQRIDHFRKHALAMMAMLGEEPSLEIQGVWLFRGHGIPVEMKDHPQFEYYKVRELSVDSEEDRKLITDFWCAKAGETVNGLKVQECKLHK